jgi:hypothetical protein
MKQVLRDAIARIDFRTTNGLLSRGTGFLVTDRLVLTARHVVADGNVLVKGPLALQFPARSVKAHVVEDCTDVESDWALLECEESLDIPPLKLGNLEEDGVQWTTFGFPREMGPLGMAHGGTVRNTAASVSASQAHPSIQLFSDEAAAGAGAQVRGLSGAPCLVNSRVVGILRQALHGEDGESVAGTLFATPISAVRAGCGKRLPAPTKEPFRPALWVLIAGVGRHHIPRAAVAVAQAVGRELATRGYGLIIGGWEGVDYLAAEAFAKVIARQGKQLSASLKQIVSGQPHFKGGEVIQVGTGVQEWVRSIQDSCAVVLIGGADEAHGRDGTFETYEYALQEQKPVFPFGKIPGGSARAYRAMLEGYDAAPIDRLLANVPRDRFERALGADLEQDADAAGAATELMQLIALCDG